MYVSSFLLDLIAQVDAHVLGPSGGLLLLKPVLNRNQVLKVLRLLDVVE